MKFLFFSRFSILMIWGSVGGATEKYIQIYFILTTEKAWNSNHDYKCLTAMLEDTRRCHESLLGRTSNAAPALCTNTPAEMIWHLRLRDLVVACQLNHEATKLCFSGIKAKYELKGWVRIQQKYISIIHMQGRLVLKGTLVCLKYQTRWERPSICHIYLPCPWRGVNKNEAVQYRGGKQQQKHFICSVGSLTHSAFRWCYFYPIFSIKRIHFCLTMAHLPRNGNDVRKDRSKINGR